MTSTYLIIGAGIAGLTAATSIRSQDKTATIILINGETYMPYKRTSLSKYFAAGFAPQDFTLATPKDLQEFYCIQLVQDTICRVDYEEKRAISQQGEYHYQYLILATGARYELPPSLKSLSNLQFYHNKQETLALREQVCKRENIAVIGAGIQGMETCYELLKMGKRVTLIDPNEIPLARFHSPYISAYLKQDLAERKVQCYWGERIAENSLAILENFDLTIGCFGTTPMTELFPHKANLQGNLLLAENVFACGDNLIYPQTKNQDGKPQSRTSRCTLWHEAMDLGQLAGLNAARLVQGAAVAELATYTRKVYRTKIEVGGKIIFLAPPLNLSLESFAGEEQYNQKHFLLPNQNYYQFLLDSQGKLFGASLLCEDRDLLKPLQQAIWNQLECEQTYESLDIPKNCEFDGIYGI